MLEHVFSKNHMCLSGADFTQHSNDVGTLFLCTMSRNAQKLDLKM